MANEAVVADHLRTNIYFIGAPGGPIKIGHAKDVQTRLLALQTGHPERLEIIATIRGPASLEREYHRKFKRWRMAGEWFRRCGEIEHEILRIDPTAMPRIDEWADLAGTQYGCSICGPYPCRDRLSTHPGTMGFSSSTSAPASKGGKGCTRASNGLLCRARTTRKSASDLLS